MPCRASLVTHVVAAVAIGVLASAAGAGNFAAYSAQRHDRFSSGTIANPTFLLSGYDLSAIAIDGASSVRGTALITPEHVIGAWHFRPTTVDFVGTDGVTRTYTVADWTRLNTNGFGSDVAIGQLSTEVLPSHNINPLPLAIGPDSAFVGSELYAFAQANRAGRNLIDAVGTIYLNDDPSNNPTVVTAYDFDSYVNGGTGGVGDDEIGLEGGDSGHITLISHGGQLGVLGANFAIDASTIDPPLTEHYSSYSSFARDYLSQIEFIVEEDGQTLTTLFIPEPASAMLLGAAGVLLLRRRSGAA